VRLRDLLQAAGLKPGAVYTGHYGADPHLSGDTSKESISRGVPIAKALEEHGLLVFAMNGEPLPHIHGGPVRLVIPGWPGSASHKWLTRIWVRDREHDGQGMGGTSYRVPIRPMIPGGEADPKNFRILESMPLRSVVTEPGERHGTPRRHPRAEPARRRLERRHRRQGRARVHRLRRDLDRGAPGRAEEPLRLAALDRDVRLPEAGYYEVWSRATDAAGVMQPHVAGGWNPQGYGANAMHRIAVLAS
jgi:DMSO/TMAO reductase YedYZ molybdopterin-dependent catalytic subunit